jgi:hypothetical protein
MSDEEGVIPFEVARDATPQRVTPVVGKEALGTWRTQGGPWTQIQDELALEVGSSPEVNRRGEGCM